MNWHIRFAQQAKWTRGLRTYIFDKIKLNESSRVLEVGCGTGAVLSELPTYIAPHGLDLASTALKECRSHAPFASLTQGNVLNLPYQNDLFDVVYCHYFLLWVRDPLKALLEMRRVTKLGGNIVAFAEPDYSNRIDEPKDLVQLGKWQTESLKRQGADPGLGARLAELFFQVGVKIIETGAIQNTGNEASHNEWEIEWAVIESDLAGFVSMADIHKMKALDKTAREVGKRVLNVPTYFAWGQT